MKKQLSIMSISDPQITLNRLGCMKKMTEWRSKVLVREPDQMSVPLLVANAIIPFWTALGVRIEKKCDSQSDSVAFRFYKHF